MTRVQISQACSRPSALQVGQGQPPAQRRAVCGQQQRLALRKTEVVQVKQRLFGDAGVATFEQRLPERMLGK